MIHLCKCRNCISDVPPDYDFGVNNGLAVLSGELMKSHSPRSERLGGCFPTHEAA